MADQLARVGVTDLVTISDDSARRIGSSPRFKKIWQASPLAVFAVLSSPGQPPPAALISANGPLNAKLIVGEPEHDEIAVSASAPMTATIAIGYSPKWHATLNGKAVALTETPDGMLEVALPAGSERLDLRFEEDIWDYLGTAVSCVTALGLIAVVVLRRRRRRRVEPGAAALTETAEAPSELDGAVREG